MTFWMRFLAYLGKKSQGVLITVAIILVLVIAYIDLLTGVELSLSIFYLVPIAIVAWFSGRLGAYFISILSALSWFLVDAVDFFKLHAHLYPFIPYWNAGVRLGIFLILASVIARLKQSFEDELKVAAEIQQGFLPTNIPKIAGIEISGSTQPSHAVSGDYYDVLAYDDNKIGLCVADVVGHGIPAALLMSNLQAAVKIFTSAYTSPTELCKKLNATVYNNVVKGKFITFFYGLFDIKTLELTFANAGHNPPILLRKDTDPVFLDASNLCFGVLRNVDYEEHKIRLKPGDLLFLFTDGVTESENSRGEQFGVERLVTLLQNNFTLGANELRDTVLNKLTDFCNGVFPDDITMLIIRVN